MSHSTAKVIKRQDLGKTQGSIPTTAGLQSELLNNYAKEASIHRISGNRDCQHMLFANLKRLFWQSGMQFCIKSHLPHC